MIRRPWLLACLLSITAHIGLVSVLSHGRSMGSLGTQRVFLVKAIVVAPQPGGQGLADKSRPDSVPSVMVPDPLSQSATALEPEEFPMAPSSVTAQNPSTKTDTHVTGFLPEPHYFKPGELTEKPVFLRDEAPSQPQVLPDISPQPVIAHLLINEEGSIDQVLIEGALLSEQAKRFVQDSFAKTIFSPGKVGDMPVKSQLTIEVRLDSLLQLE